MDSQSANPKKAWLVSIGAIQGVLAEAISNAAKIIPIASATLPSEATAKPTAKNLAIGSTAK